MQHVAHHVKVTLHFEPQHGANPMGVQCRRVVVTPSRSTVARREPNPRGAQAEQTTDDSSDDWSDEGAIHVCPLRVDSQRMPTSSIRRAYSERARQEMSATAQRAGPLRTCAG